MRRGRRAGRRRNLANNCSRASVRTSAPPCTRRRRSSARGSSSSRRAPTGTRQRDRDDETCTASRTDSIPRSPSARRSTPRRGSERPSRASLESRREWRGLRRAMLRNRRKWEPELQRRTPNRLAALIVARALVDADYGPLGPDGVRCEPQSLRPREHDRTLSSRHFWVSPAVGQWAAHRIGYPTRRTMNPDTKCLFLLFGSRCVPNPHEPRRARGLPRGPLSRRRRSGLRSSRCRQCFRAERERRP